MSETPNWSPQQAAALDKAKRWLQTKDKPYFTLGGWAGTGKTTLARHIAASAQGRVLYAAPTGKAAHVLAKTGLENVSTIHQLIYQPKDKSQQHLRELQSHRLKLLTLEVVPEKELEQIDAQIEAERANLSRPMFALKEESLLEGASLLVVDEYSMISEQMGADLVSFGVPILALGDPGQLPPVQAAPYFQAAPDVMLTEIHRQAEDNPIIWLSREIREGRALAPGAYGSSAVARYEDLRPERLAERILQADQLLVGRNATRVASNDRVRDLRELRDPMPEPGDKLVCLRNNHDSGLLNGQIWYAEEASKKIDPKTLMVELVDDTGKQRVGVFAHTAYFEGKTPPPWEMSQADCFDYGYALTVHKSQGSQWGNVVLLDEWYSRDRRQWLYTAVTRASESIRIVQM